MPMLNRPSSEGRPARQRRGARVRLHKPTPRLAQRERNRFSLLLDPALVLPRGDDRFAALWTLDDELCSVAD